MALILNCPNQSVFFKTLFCLLLKFLGLCPFFFFLVFWKRLIYNYICYDRVLTYTTALDIKNRFPNSKFQLFLLLNQLLISLIINPNNMKGWNYDWRIHLLFYHCWQPISGNSQTYIFSFIILLSSARCAVIIFCFNKSKKKREIIQMLFLVKLWCLVKKRRKRHLALRWQQIAYLESTISLFSFIDILKISSQVPTVYI